MAYLRGHTPIHPTARRRPLGERTADLSRTATSWWRRLRVRSQGWGCRFLVEQEEEWEPEMELKMEMELGRNRRSATATAPSLVRSLSTRSAS